MNLAASARENRSEREVAFWVMDLQVRVVSDFPRLAAAIRAAWEPALLPSCPAGEADLDYRLSEDGLFLGPRQLTNPLDESSLLGRFERHLLDEVTRRKQDAVLLHAAAFMRDGSVALLLGASGAGKSTLSREAISQGGLYVSDDFIALGGDAMLGAGRSVQFDPVSPGFAGLHVAGCDLESYPTDVAGQPCRVPLVRGGYRATAVKGLAKRRVHVCSLARGQEDRCEAVSSLEGIAWLHAAALENARPYDGSLDAARFYRLTWCEPARAWQSLLAAGTWD